VTLVLDAHIHTDELCSSRKKEEKEVCLLSKNESAPVQYDVMADLLHANMCVSEVL
jgi:hypothetical protein